MEQSSSVRQASARIISIDSLDQQRPATGALSAAPLSLKQRLRSYLALIVVAVALIVTAVQGLPAALTGWLAALQTPTFASVSQEQLEQLREYPELFHLYTIARQTCPLDRALLALSADPGVSWRGNYDLNPGRVQMIYPDDQISASAFSSGLCVLADGPAAESRIAPYNAGWTLLDCEDGKCLYQVP